MVRNYYSLQKQLLSAIFAFSSSLSYAQINLDFSTASVGLGSQSTINISNISYGNSKYDAVLQWNPIAARFDITTAVQSSNTPRKCSLGKQYGATYLFNAGTDITLTTDPIAKTITIAYTPQANYNMSSQGGLARTLEKLWNLSIIQQGAQLYLTTNSGSTSTNTALYTQSADPITGAQVDWGNVPAGATRYATVTKIPSWFNFSQPITSIYDSINGGSATCQ